MEVWPTFTLKNCKHVKKKKHRFVLNFSEKKSKLEVVSKAGESACFSNTIRRSGKKWSQNLENHDLRGTLTGMSNGRHIYDWWDNNDVLNGLVLEIYLCHVLLWKITKRFWWDFFIDSSPGLGSGWTRVWSTYCPGLILLKISWWFLHQTEGLWFLQFSYTEIYRVFQYPQQKKISLKIRHDFFSSLYFASFSCSVNPYCFPSYVINFHFFNISG